MSRQVFVMVIGIWDDLDDDEEYVQQAIIKSLASKLAWLTIQPCVLEDFGILPTQK